MVANSAQLKVINIISRHKANIVCNRISNETVIMIYFRPPIDVCVEVDLDLTFMGGEET